MNLSKNNKRGVSYLCQNMSVATSDADESVDDDDAENGHMTRK